MTARRHLRLPHRKDPVTRETARERFEEAARAAHPAPSMEGRGIVISAGGPFVPSAYVAVRLLRRLGVRLPIQIWHAGEDEIPDWARRAFEPCDVTLHDVMHFCPDRPLSEMRGWPIKPAALMNTSLREVLFVDADCFLLRSPEFLFESAEYRDHRALFWPDSRFHRMVPGAAIWDLTGLSHRGDTELETGLFLVDKEACWRELCLAEWLNAHSSFWYEHVLGDKDTFYLAWRKHDRSYFMAPPCKRHSAVISRHFWVDGEPIADHRAGSAKYDLPKRKGPFTVHLAPYRWRPNIKNVYDELMQRFFVKEFALHVGFLGELKGFHERYG